MESLPRVADRIVRLRYLFRVLQRAALLLFLRSLLNSGDSIFPPRFIDAGKFRAEIEDLCGIEKLE